MHLQDYFLLITTHILL